jgi:hypothetical protein
LTETSALFRFSLANAASAGYTLANNAQPFNGSQVSAMRGGFSQRISFFLNMGHILWVDSLP